MLPRFGILVVLCSTTAGCSDNQAPTDAASVDGGEADAGTGVPPPRIPWLADGAPPVAAPTLTPCAEGWAEIDRAGTTACEPFPAAAADECPGGQAQFPGEAGCQVLGATCPAGDFAEGLPSIGVTYVRAGAPPGGDGTLASPYGALSEVRWTSLDDGVTVALSRGSFEGSVPLRAGVRLVGACANETTLTGLEAPVASVISVSRAGTPARVEGLSISGAPQAAVTVERGRSLHLEGVIIDGVLEAGIYAFDAGTELTIRDVVIRNVRERATDGTLGRGIIAQRGAQVTATHLIAEANRDVSVFASGEGTVVELADSVIRGTLPQRDGAGGRGLTSQLGARATLSRLLVADNHDYGLYTGGAGASLSVVDSVIRDTQPHRGGSSGGHGLGAQVGGELTVARVLLEGNEGGGVLAQDGETEVSLSHCVISGPEAPTKLTRGLSVEYGGMAAATQTVIHRSSGTGVYADGEGSGVSLEDVRIEGVTPRPDDGTTGRGIGIQNGARLDATKLSVTATHDIGIYLSDAATTGDLADVLVRRIEARPGDLTFGRGVDVERGAQVTITRLLVEEAREIAVLADGDRTSVTLTDAVIRDTRPSALDDSDGRGLNVQMGAILEGTRLLLASNYAFGISATFGTATLSDVAIRDTRRAACRDTTCGGAPYGYAASATNGDLRLTRFLIDGAETCGVMVSDAFGTGGGVDLEEGVISTSTIGACLQIDGYDLSRLMAGVIFRDNETNLISTTLPVPEPSSAL